MRFFSLFILFSLVVAISNAAPVGTENQNTASLKKKDNDQKTAKENTKKITIPDRTQPIDLPAPVGEDMKGITIPQYDPDGRLVMKFYADTARKIDDHHVEIHQIKIDFFQKDGKDVTVTLPQGKFNLETKMLSSDNEVIIKREDFEMVGQSVDFDTVKRSGTMKGHVHTDIRNGIPPQDL